MPTIAEMEELYQYTTRSWVTQNGVFGMLYTASNGNSIFLPAAGWYDNIYHNYTYDVYRWSSSLCNSPTSAYAIGYFTTNTSLSPDWRYRGFPVRPVRSVSYSISIMATPNPAEGGIVTGIGSFEVGDTCTLIAMPNEGFVFSNWTENGNVVSTETTYSFIVDGNRALVANFILEYVNGNNLVFNGDVELGNIGFSTEYIYENTGSCNHYYVGHDIAEMWSWDSPGFAVGDHTTGEGLFMMIEKLIQWNEAETTSSALLIY